jgi:ABC-type glycerol-3-phosphate transport system permease component
MKIPALNVKTRNKILIYFLVTLIAILFIVPLLVDLNTAFKPPEEVFDVTSLPSRFYLVNFIEGFHTIARGMLNSFLYAFPSMLTSTFVGTLAAYPLSQLKFKGDTFVYMLLLVGLYVPAQAVLIPLFLLIRAIGLYDTFPGLWLVGTAYGIPYTTMILRNFFTTIPTETREAASLDGCTLIGYYWRILIPVGKTGIAATFILQFRAIWNDFIFGLTVTRRPNIMPVTVYLQSLIDGLAYVGWGPLMASTLIAIIPSIAIFLVCKRYFVAGLTSVYK